MAVIKNATVHRNPNPESMVAHLIMHEQDLHVCLVAEMLIVMEERDEHGMTL